METEPLVPVPLGPQLQLLVPTPPVRHDGPLIERGVHQAPWLGEHGRPVYVTVSAEHRQLDVCELPADTDPVAFELALNERLNVCDPVPAYRRRLRLA